MIHSIALAALLLLQAITAPAKPEVITGTVLAGRVVIEGGAPMPPVYVNLMRVPYRGSAGDLTSFGVNPDGTFRTTVTEGEYKVELRGLGLNYRIKSILSGSADLMKDTLQTGNRPSELLVTLEPSSIAIWRTVSGKVAGDAPTGTRTQVLMVGGSIRGSRVAAVNSDGTFEFTQVSPGSYTLGVAAGVVFSRGTEIRVDEDVKDVELKAPRPLALNGRVVVEGTALSNLPAVNFDIRQAGGVLGEITIHSAEAFRIPVGEGNYQVFVRMLPFGYELKSISFGNVDLLKDPLQIKEPLTDSIRIVLGVLPESKAAGVRITGRATGAVSTANPQRVLIFSAGSQDMTFPAITAGVKTDGTFQFERVPPGNYLARLVTMPASEFVPITVGTTDVSGVELASKGVELSGTVGFEGDGQPPDFTRVMVSAVQIDSLQEAGLVASTETFGARVNANGTFKLVVPVGTVRISVGGPRGYMLKSMTQGSTDLRQQPLRVQEGDSATFEPLHIIIQPVSR